MSVVYINYNYSLYILKLEKVDVVVFFQFWRFRKYTAITRNDLTRLVCFLPMLLAFVLYVGKVDIS